jgi:hypothetical protein
MGVRPAKSHEKTEPIVGQPILAGAAFQAAFFSLRASLAKGTSARFSPLSPEQTCEAARIALKALSLGYRAVPLSKIIFHSIA